MNKFYKNSLILFIYWLFLYSIYFSITNPIFFTLSDRNNIKNNIQVSQENLKKHVEYLSSINRTTQTWIVLTQNYIKSELNSYWISLINEQHYKVWDENHENIIVDFELNPKYETYVVGAHYDACDGNPWADDNVSGVAWVLEIARLLKDISLQNRNIELVFYSTEEPPNFWTHDMWSYYHAKSIKNKNIKMVLVYDMIWYFSEENDSQSFPAEILKYVYPTTGNYIAVVSNFSNFFTNREIKAWMSWFVNEKSTIWVESINAFDFIAGIDFSDHRNYWEFSIPAVMITDTSFYRNPNYHAKTDTMNTLDFQKIWDVVWSTVYTILNTK